MQDQTTNDYRAAAIVAAAAANEKKAVDIIVQEVGPLIGVADYFVIATGANPRQVDAIIDEIEDKLREKCEMKPYNREIASDSSWSLLDYGALVIHVFMPEAREFYRLEQLWPEAAVIDLVSEGGLSDLEYSDRISQVAHIAQTE